MNETTISQKLDEAARVYAGIPLDRVIDAEERYYQTHWCQIYDAFMAGAKFANPVEEKGSSLIELLGLDDPYSLTEVLDRLIWATEYLLHKKSYDGHNYEELEQSVRRAKEIKSLIIKNENYRNYRLTKGEPLTEAILLLKEMHNNALYKVGPGDDRPTHLPIDLFDKVEEYLKNNPGGISG